MILKIGRPKGDGKKGLSNTGSCGQYVKYLCKEDKEKDQDRELFFNQDRDDVLPEEVSKSIDSDRSGLKKTDAKFYSIIIAPEDRELEHIVWDKKKLKDYAREVMDIYAKSFSRENGDRKSGVQGK